MARLCSLAALCAALLAGCSSNDLIEPAFNVIGKTMVVVPFKTTYDGHFDSEAGTKLAKDITNQVMINADEEELTMISAKALLNLESELDVRALSWEQLAAELDADYVVVGEIIELRTRSINDIGMLRGRLKLEYSVYDFTHDGEVIFSHKPEFEHPDPRAQKFLDYSVTETEDDAVERALLKQAARRIALNFYSHLPEEEWSE